MSAKVLYHPGYWRCHTEDIQRVQNPFRPEKRSHFGLGFFCGLLWTFLVLYGVRALLK